MTFSYTHTIHFIVFTPVTLACSPPTSLILFFFPACLSSPFKTCWWWWWWCCCCCCWWWWCYWHCWWWWWLFITVVCRGIGQGYLQEHRDQCLQPWRKMCLLLSSTTNCHRLWGRVGGASWAPPPPGQDGDRPNLIDTLCRITECDDYDMARKQCSTNTSLLLSLLTPALFCGVPWFWKWAMLDGSRRLSTEWSRVLITMTITSPTVTSARFKKSLFDKSWL